MEQHDPGRRRVRIFAFAIAAAFGVAAVLNWISGIEDLRAGSTSLGPTDERLAVTSVPTSYTAVFRVEDRAAAELSVTTEKIWVQRPFESRVEVWSGPPPGDDRLSIRLSNFGVLTNRGRNAEPVNLAAPPSLASGDLRIDAALDRAVDDDVVVPMERREVYGRQCQVYRAGGPVFAGDITPYDEDDTTYADICVDVNGLVIEEVWTTDDRIIRRRVAVEVETDVPIDEELLTIDVPAEEGPTRGHVQSLPGADITDVWRLPEAPAGFDDLGNFGVILPEAAIPQLSPLVDAAAPTSVSQVYVDGPDLVVVDQDPSLAIVTRNEGRQTQAVEIDGLSDVILIVDARMSEVRGTDAEGSIVRVFGTLDPARLIELARSLEPPP